MSRFRNGVFISYAHADNKGGWVDAFHSSLEAWLGVLGVAAPIWRDKKLQGADVFTDEILDQLKQSALLVSILSPNGMRSNWCEMERQKFEQFAETSGGFRIGNVVRALKVVMTPAEDDAHQAVFGTIGFEFFEKNSQTGLFDHYLPSESKFEKQTDRLAQTIKNNLQTLASALPEPTRATIYVAEVTSDLEEDRTRLIDQLKAWKYNVAPAAPLPTRAPELRAAVQSGLAGAVMSVHLLSDKRGAIPDDEDKSILAIQYELATASSADRIVWVLPGKQPHPSIEKEIEAGSEHGLERLEGATTIEDLKELLAAKLKSIEDRGARPSTSGSKLNIYVVCDRKDNPFSDEAVDRERTLALKSFFDNEGYVVWLPPATATDPDERDRDHRETLQMSDAVILYWGTSDEAWFRGTLRELTKARSTTRRQRPFVAEALYLGRPSRPEKSQYGRHLDLVVEQFDSFQPDALRPFLDRLRLASEPSVS
jgi:hypothetical protein